jgi:Rps23 Pro-64 3,4-dihydroxylase Tpa1-like proline 4-hydroxylase
MPVGDIITPVINPLLNLSELRAEFAKNQKVVIKDWMDTATAENLWRFLDKEMPRNWLFSSSVPSLKVTTGQSNDYNDCDKFRNIPENQPDINLSFDIAHKGLSEGKFSYFFWRSFDDHVSDCICQECQLSRFFSTPNFIQFLNAITGNTLNITNPFTIFTSKYSQGCFLNTHSDDMNGRLAFVYHLTKDWRPDFGGLFTAQDKDRNILKTVVPSFNKFVCFKVGDYVAPHSVTQVAHNVQKHRISLSGWYK